MSDNRGNTMEAIKQPNPLDLSGNISENWKKFYQEFELYMDASGLAEKGDKQKIALLLHVAQKQAIEVYNTFTFAKEEEGKYDEVVKRFKAHCNPKTNETYERYIFNSRNQAQGEPSEQFITDLKLKARTCGFGTLKDSMIRDRIVLGVNSPRIRERLLREEDLTLDTAIKICQAAEAAQRQIQTLGQEEAGAVVNMVKGQRPSRGRNRDSNPHGSGTPSKTGKSNGHPESQV